MIREQLHTMSRETVHVVRDPCLWRTALNYLATRLEERYSELVSQRPDLVVLRPYGKLNSADVEIRTEQEFMVAMSPVIDNFLKTPPRQDTTSKGRVHSSYYHSQDLFRY